MLTQIKNLNDAQVFFEQLIEEGTDIDPDDDFRSIITLSTGVQAYSKAEADKRNQLMRQSFKICKATNVDIYDLSLTVTLRKTGLGKLIPEPGTPVR